MTTVKTAGEAGTALIESIKSKDASKFVTEVQQYREGMKDTTVGSDFVLWISEPANLTKVKEALAEDLGVPPRALMIKRLAMSRTQKAVLLLQAMEIAVKRVHSL
jgi:hypothetical protein